MVMGGGPRPSTMWGDTTFFLKGELNLLMVKFEKMNLLGSYNYSPLLFS